MVKINTKGFTIKLNKPAPEDLKFTWSALAVKDAKTAVSSPQPSPSSTSTPSHTPSTFLSPPQETTSSATINSPQTITIKDSELGYVRIRIR